MSFRHRLILFRLPTENRQFCATKSSTFPEKLETLRTKLQGFSSGFLQGNQANKWRKMSRKYRRKKGRKNTSNRPKNGPKGGQWRRVAGDHGARESRFGPGNPHFPSFFVFRSFQPLGISKIHTFETSKPLTSVKITGQSSRVSNHHWSPNGRPRKCTFLSERLRNRLDKCHRPAVSYQCLKLHGHLMSINMLIHQWLSPEEFQKTRHGPLLFKCPATT